MAEIFDSTFANIERSMIRAEMKQEISAHNIANAEVPGFVPQKFDDVLNKAVDKTDRKFNLEQEMADMAKNSGEYSAYTKFLAAKLAVLRSIVTQGRK